MTTEKSPNRKNLFDLIIDSMAYIAGVLLLLIILLVTYSVVTRYLGLPTPIWVLQITEYALLWITFLATAWLLKKGGHIRIDTVLSSLPPKIRHKIEIFNAILGILVTSIIVFYGSIHTIDMVQRNILDIKSFNIPKALIFWIIPFGSLFLVIQFARFFVNRIKGNLE